MDKESRSQPERTEAGVPAPAGRLDEVVKRVKAELVSGHERRRGFNPYDGQLGRPNYDVWTRRRSG